MASPNATTFGASIVPVEQRGGNNEAPRFSSDSFVVTPQPSHEDLRTNPIVTDRNGSPSPLYSQQRQPPPPAPLISTHHPSPSKATTLIDEKDLEAGPASPLTAADEPNPFTSKVSLDCNKECKMWPSKQTLLQSRMAEKKRKRESKWCGGCGPVKDFWATFTARQKLLIKIFVALLVVGVAVAVGVGISVAVHAPVYANPNHTQQIPQPNS